MKARCRFVRRVFYTGQFFRKLHSPLLMKLKERKQAKKKTLKIEKMCFVFLCSSLKEPYVHNVADWPSSANYSAHLCSGALGTKKKPKEPVSFPARQIRLVQN